VDAAGAVATLGMPAPERKQPTMSMMADEPAFAELQREVQRLLGRCLLRLQQYERLLKELLLSREAAGTVATSPARLAKRAGDLRTATLGTLVKELCGSYVVTGEAGPAEPVDVAKEALTAGLPTFSFRLSIQMSEERVEQTRQALSELVALRNGLVHHLLEQFDLWSMEGCERAHDHLTAAYGRIEVRWYELSVWAKSSDQARAAMASFMQTERFQDCLVNGIRGRHRRVANRRPR
jgi:hypothetical protein